jgi:putative ABC transport system permease protein
MRLNLSQNIRSALRALLANKLRSALTMLGIVIGVGAVVALMSIGTGAQASITNRIEGIGANLINVRRHAISSRRPAPEVGDRAADV